MYSLGRCFRRMCAYMSYIFPVPQQGNDINVKEQTLLWQQSSYLADSGISTGLATQAASLSGKDDDLMERDQILFDLDQGFNSGFTQEQVDGTVLFS